MIGLLMFCCGTDISFCQVMRLKLQYRPEQDVLVKIKILGTFVTIKFIRWFDKEKVWNSQADFFTSKLFLVGAFHSALFDTTSLQQNTFYIKNSAVNRRSLYNWEFTRHYQFHLTIKPRSVLLSVWLFNCSAPDTSSMYPAASMCFPLRFHGK